MARATWMKLGVLAAMLAAVVAGLQCSGVDLRQLSPERLRRLILSFGVWAPIIYLLTFTQPLVPFPITIMTMAGGLAFGPLWGGLAALAGGTIRATTQFHVARLLGRDAIQGLLRGRAAAFSQRFGDAGLRAIVMVRAVPNFPFDIQNYLLGFSHVRFLPYIAGTFLVLVPVCFAYTLLGDSLAAPRQTWKLAAALASLAVLACVPRVWTRRSMSNPSGERACGLAGGPPCLPVKPGVQPQS